MYRCHKVSSFSGKNEENLKKRKKILSFRGKSVLSQLKIHCNSKMRYEVVCTKCNNPFAIDTAGGQKVQCLCPYCGKEMTVKVPDVDERQYAADHQDNNGCLKTLVVVLVALLIIMGVGGWIYYDYLNTQARRLENEQKAAAYRQHYDSLMQQRERQAAEWAEQPIDESHADEEFSTEGEIETETNQQQSYETNKDSLQH